MTIFGSTAPGEVVTVVDGTIVLDASFNAGGDTVVLPGNADSYSAILSGSFVTIAGGGISISIPVGLAGLTVDFADGDRSLRYDTTAGQVMLGDQPVTNDGAGLWDYRIAPETTDTGFRMDHHDVEIFADTVKSHLDPIDSFYLG